MTLNDLLALEEKMNIEFDLMQMKVNKLDDEIRHEILSMMPKTAQFLKTGTDKKLLENVVISRALLCASPAPLGSMNNAQLAEFDTDELANIHEINRRELARIMKNVRS